MHTLDLHTHTYTHTVEVGNTVQIVEIQIHNGQSTAESIITRFGFKSTGSMALNLRIKFVSVHTLLQTLPALI